MKMQLFKNLNLIQHQVNPFFSLNNKSLGEFFISVKKYDPSTFLEKIEQSLENVVNGVMQAGSKR